MPPEQNNIPKSIAELLEKFGVSKNEPKEPSLMDGPERAIPENDKGPLKTLRTFQGDMAELLGKTDGSLTSVLIAEEKKREKSPEVPAEQTQNRITIKRGLFVYIGIILIVLGGAGLFIAFSTKKTQAPIVNNNDVVIQYFTEKIATKKTWERNDLFVWVSKEKAASNYPLGSIVLLNAMTGTSSSLSIDDFLSIIGPKMSSSLSRSFDKYMLGLYTDNTNIPFIILSVADFGQAYSEMLRWEKNIPSDLNGLFSFPKLSTTSPYNFEDKSVKNVDLRVIRGDNDKVILLYTFLDKKTLLITSNEIVFNAILSRYMNKNYTR